MHDSAGRLGISVPATLTCDPAKRERYASDTYYIEASDQLTESGHELEEFAFRHATLLLKPDAVVSRGLEPAIDWLGENGFCVVAAERTRLSRTMLRALWYFQWNQATSHRRHLADLFAPTTDSLVLLVREKEPGDLPASVRLTELKGPAAPQKRVPGQLRHLLGRYTYLLNLAHTADEPVDVLRELGVYFGADQRDEVYASAMQGADQGGRARNLAAELYAETTPVDLSFDPAAARLDATFERALAAGELPAAVRAELDDVRAQPDAERYRRALRACRQHGVELDPWDTVIVGSAVFPMTRKGFAPVLRGIDANAWYRHVADLDVVPVFQAAQT
jgi:nucleoside diphosphate kinase